MSRIFITGSSTGLGLMAAQLLIEQGHQLVLHGRNKARDDEAAVEVILLLFKVHTRRRFVKQ